MQESSATIGEKDIRNNTVVKEGNQAKVDERMAKLEQSLKDLEKAYSLGIISESTYSKSKAKIEEEKERIEQSSSEISTLASESSTHPSMPVEVAKNEEMGATEGGEKVEKKINKPEEVKDKDENVLKEKEPKVENVEKVEQVEESKVKEEINKEGSKEERVSQPKVEIKELGTLKDLEDEEKSRDEIKREEDNTLKSRHIKEYEKLKENWLKDLESLRNLYEHGIIEEEEYEKSKADIEAKIGKIEVLIKRELEKEELEELKERIEREIKQALASGVFKEEEEKYKKDLKALENLYRRGLISKEEYDEKRKEIEKEIGNYKRLIEVVDAIFEKYINELNAKVENIQRETQQKEIKADEKEEKEKEEKKKETWWTKILRILGLYKEEKEEEESSTLEKRIKDIYKHGDPRFKISEMAMEIKKEVKEMLNIDQALTYSELREKLKQDNTLTPELKSKLIDYFNDIEIKEYLSEGKEEDVEKVYKSTLSIAQEIETFKKSKKIKNKSHESKGEENKKEESKGKNESENKGSVKEDENKKERQEVKEEKEEEGNKKHESIFDKINNFFGV